LVEGWKFRVRRRGDGKEPVYRRGKGDFESLGYRFSGSVALGVKEEL
jgi:hypothetical protein